MSWVVLLRRDNQRSTQPVKFTAPGERSCRMLVTDLAPGHWRAQREGSADTVDLMVTADSGTAWFEGPAGTWVVSQ